MSPAGWPTPNGPAEPTPPGPLVGSQKMTIAWLAVFADVPEPLVPAALEFWAAVTGSLPQPAAGDHDEYLPLAGPDEDAYLWLQRVRRPEPAVRQPDQAGYRATSVVAAATRRGRRRLGSSACRPGLRR